LKKLFDSARKVINIESSGVAEQIHSILQFFGKRIVAINALSDK
jgi:hypothetical protein